MTKVFVLANLWDIVDLGTDESLDEIQALGAAGISLVCTSGPVAQLRVHGDCEPRVFRSGGGFFFQPAEDGYRDTRLKPLVSTWCRNRNPLESIVEGCSKRGLAFRLRISAFEVGRMAERHADSAGQTVFGDKSPLTLCPGDPHVRALLRSTCADLADYGPAAIEIDDTEYHSGVFAGDGVDFGWEPNVAFSALLNTCFAKPSRQLAAESGVDVDVVADYVAGTLERAAESGDGPDTADAGWSGRSQPLAAYLACQQTTLQSALAGVTEATTAETTIISRTVPGERNIPNLPLPITPDLDSLNDSVVQIADSEDASAAIDDTAERYGQRGGIELGVGEMCAHEPQLLVRTCQHAAERGIPTMVLGYYGLWPESSGEVVKQAVRFAKRTNS